MATSAMDPMLAEHYRTWVGFTRLIRYVIGALVLILALLGYFLV
jgi:hypothetical protein